MAAPEVGVRNGRSTASGISSLSPCSRVDLSLWKNLARMRKLDCIDSSILSRTACWCAVLRSAVILLYAISEEWREREMVSFF